MPAFLPVLRMLLVCAMFAMTAPAIAATPLPAQDAELTRIAFGSCSKETLPQPIWNAVLSEKPALFVFLVADGMVLRAPELSARW